MYISCYIVFIVVIVIYTNEKGKNKKEYSSTNQNPSYNPTETGME